MSIDIKTGLGTLRRCEGGVWLLWCPVCEGWERLNEEQMEGRLSVNHAATGCPSGYHETHEFAKEVAVAITAFRFAPYGDDPVVRS
jgi:hypothetical protein